MDLAPIMRMAARNTLIAWGREVTEQALDDLVQDLWVWYLERPSTQRKVERALETSDHFNERQQRAYVRKLFVGEVSQCLAQESLENDLFQGRPVYSSESIKEALKGDTTNKLLVRMLPLALAELELYKPAQREAIRLRYDDGTVPSGDAAMSMLKRAHISLFQIITTAVISARQMDDRKPDGATRQATGGHGDPTADMALALMGAGDAEILIYNREGEIVDHTTLRGEFLTDDFQMGPTGRAGTDQDTLFDSGFTDIERGAMYRAQVFPELYPEEGRMLIENWPQEDLEAYCGGEHTVGYRHLTVVR